ncbi:MAG: AmmeMemoRadiSam system radical SAM enzyme [Verrucomicrobia bacterium]|nr:AmmeMemoRadiSam system radical SAM enzyme [Verrucomicrobiota bacterium]MDI9379588.1 AmmeMemoRadiSam system radical SAM enzyme [Verrucomicrobiota bacterium]NMD22237.1 AmmeMemoRadiSam system radical SAM enzyme [Verrucomicrobiota bacterium]HOA61821.1 AmmeMemoRadiSam system radical SAM enzyme [Verrucomicrobiota bacterium]HOF47484.1 AmmeMemoRadiSam system radical SAM enzyme [Verrucomicrobiota bacterium]
MPIPRDEPGQSWVPASSRFAESLDRHTAVGSLWRAEGGKVRCFACGHRCLIGLGRRGVCKVRLNSAGQLRVPFGYVSGAACDPVEKKPFYHLLPGSGALTFGMFGCDFHCAYCQNWITSQALRDESAGTRIQPITSDELVGAAQRQGARLMVSSYNEPFITSEWAAEVFARARPAGLVCGFVSNGNATREALDFLEPWLQAVNIDLKTFDDRRYRSLGGTLERVIGTIRDAHARGIWVEVVTLLVPGFNDTEAELRAMARFLVSVSPDIPWHVTAFHPDYRMKEPRATEAGDLVRAAEMGVAEGLRFVYAGNLSGRVGHWEDTRCSGCGQTLVRRRGFRMIEDRLSPRGCCPGCGRSIPGIWAAAGESRRESGMLDRRNALST